MRAGVFSALLVGLTLVSLVDSSGAGASPSCAFDVTSGQTTCTFPYTGAVQSWAVPADVGVVAIQAWGGQGGVQSADAGLESGGLGAFAAGTIPVDGGSVLDVTVAGDGGSTYGSAFGGGGASYLGGGGGGASSVSVHAGATLLVAGGGGGAGRALYCLYPTLAPGGNGGNADADGQPGAECEGVPGGAGGVAGAAGTPVGGSLPPNGSGHENAGAGGGGYSGGGAGQIALCVDLFCQDQTGAGGGGGGTSYVAPSASGASVGLGDRPDGSNGLVTIVYSSPGEQLTSLLAAVTGLGRGHLLGATVTGIQASLAAGHTRVACGGLFLLVVEVRVQSRILGPAEAASLVAQAKLVAATVGC